MDGAFNYGPSRSRLNQIAIRKLARLSLDVQPGSGGHTLQGVVRFAPGQLAHPMTREPIGEARFEVVGHDKLRFLDPPLSALAPVEFYDLPRAEAVGDRVAVWLRVRMGFVQDAARRMRTLGLTPRDDAPAIAVMAYVPTSEASFQLTGGPDGIRVTHVTPARGEAFAVAPAYPPLALEEYESLTDLELFLIGEIPAMKRPGSRARRATDLGGLDVVPSPDGALLAAFFGRFGPEAQVSVTPAGRIQVRQELEHGGKRYAFCAVHEEGSRFFGRLEQAGRERWSDRFDIHRFPGIYELVMTLLEIPPDPNACTDPEVVAELGVPAIPSHLTPRNGEVWVMRALVEDEQEAEIRYSCLNAHGQPYGATRVLGRADFEAVFARHGSLWRLQVKVEQVQGQNVVYRQLDASGRPRGAPKSVRIENLLANFVPEQVGK